MDNPLLPPDSHPFSSAALALQSKPPSHVVRMVSLSLCLLTGLALLFACFAEMDVVVSSQGKVIPSGKSKVVQSLEPGVVRRIAVRDGQSVKAGEILIELDPTTSGADRDRLQRDYWVSEAEVLRSAAQLAGRQGFQSPEGMPPEIALNQQLVLRNRLSEQAARVAGLVAEASKRSADADALGSQLEQLRNSLPLIEQKLSMRESLARTGHVARNVLIESQLELMNAQKEIAVQTNRRKEAEAGHQAAVQQLAQARAEFLARSSAEQVEAIRKRDTAEQDLIKARQRVDLQMLRSPIDGVVQQLAVNTVGGVVTAAQPLLTVVPEATLLEVEAQVLNRDIGHIRLGQRVIVKVETYDFTRFGYIEGEVLWVGTDAIQDQKLGPVYPVRIRLAGMTTPQAVNGRPGLVTAGMNVTADIRTDQRRMIEYLLAPLLRYQQEALRER